MKKNISKSLSRRKTRVAGGPYATAGATGDPGTLNVSLPAGPTDNFTIGFLSVIITFTGNFDADPAFSIGFDTGGYPGTHYLNASRLAPSEGKQIYVISLSPNITITSPSNVVPKPPIAVSFGAENMPQISRDCGDKHFWHLCLDISNSPRRTGNAISVANQDRCQLQAYGSPAVCHLWQRSRTADDRKYGTDRGRRRKR